MADFTPTWFKFKGYLEAQKALMNSFSRQNRSLLDYIKMRDWTLLQEKMTELQDISCQIQAVESKRHHCYQDILREQNMGSEYSFDRVVEALPMDMALELRKLRSDIALAAERITIENKSLDSYVAAKNQSIKEIMGELIPETRGSLYQHNGRIRQSDLATKSLLVNKSL